MAVRIARSVFWIASTHAVTTGIFIWVFSIPFALLNLIIFQHLSPIVEATAFICGEGLVVSVAIYCSLANIGRSVVMLRPNPCIMAANITFSGMGAGLVAIMLWNHEKHFSDTLQMCGIVIGVCCIFCVVTRRSFLEMARDPYGEKMRGFPVIIRPDVQSVKTTTDID